MALEYLGPKLTAQGSSTSTPAPATKVPPQVGTPPNLPASLCPSPGDHQGQNKHLQHPHQELSRELEITNLLKTQELGLQWVEIASQHPLMHSLGLLRGTESTEQVLALEAQVSVLPQSLLPLGNKMCSLVQ